MSNPTLPSEMPSFFPDERAYLLYRADHPRTSKKAKKGQLRSAFYYFMREVKDCSETRISLEEAKNLAAIDWAAMTDGEKEVYRERARYKRAWIGRIFGDFE